MTHRIVKIRKDKKTGSAVYRTKGDANQSVDPWQFLLQRQAAGARKMGVPKVGFFLAALADRTVRMIIIGFPAALIALFVLVGLWRDAGREAEAQAAAAATTSA